VMLRHRHQLSDPLMARIDLAIIHAARSIQQRNVDINYTNIAIRGTYVVIVTAETYKIPDLLEYGLKRLRLIHQSTMHQGAFTEYNSPIYGVCTLDVLGRMRLHVRDVLARAWAEDLYRLAWENIAHYFHPPTRQWAGPHSRSYSNLLHPSILALIETGTEGRVKFGLSESVMLESKLEVSIPCPPDLEPYFLELSKPVTRVHTILNDVPERRLTTYLGSSFTLGTVNYSDLWHQRFSLIAYWGKPKTPGFLRLRFLCDGDDFAPAQFVSVQREGDVLVGIMFATGIDKRNPYVQYKIDCICVKDLRLRFEMIGVITKLNHSADTPTYLECCIEGIWVQILMSYAQFGEVLGHWEVTQGLSETYLDWVFCKETKKTINWSSLNFAGMGIGLSLDTRLKPMVPVAQVLKDQMLTLSAYGLDLSFKVTPDTQSALNQSLSSRPLRE
jgi:hypothetical protein